ncbi:MAG: altronate hydrolase [Clostridiales bacterium]|jgi:altronate hydrolase|nr:altronate hydrolase [Clostridiales bacterium]MDN5299150.1 altronate hydrolase [Clostridiales bacterium]
MNTLKIYPKDNVAVALEPLFKGDTVIVDTQHITLEDDIPSAHKFALTAIAKGDTVIKFENAIGHATDAISVGQWVHDHNLMTNVDTSRQYQYDFDASQVVFPGKSAKTFLGYARSNGKVGIRNHLAIIPTVFCANGPLNAIAKKAAEKYPPTPYFDGVLPLTHPYGCSQTGKDLEITARTLAGIINNANFGAVLIISLGCEINDLKTLKSYIGNYDEERVKYLVLQETDDEIEAGMALCDALYTSLAADRRTPEPYSKLHIALNCGGSDGFSGLTANKILGHVAEHFVSNGSTVSMTEVPEMFGAEHILMNRAKDEATFHKIVALIADYTHYFERYGEKVSDNPTQGNKAGGLSTIEEKSLGCIQKGGRCAITEVLSYGQPATQNGLVLISGPGNDLVGITGQIASGATLTVFTTGRGTPCGFAGPTFRLSSNSGLAKKKSGWIDFDSGTLLANQSTLYTVDLVENLIAMIVQTLEGMYKTRNEINGYYQMGFLRDGVTL